MFIAFTVLLVSLTVLTGLISLSILIDLLKPLYNSLSSWFASRTVLEPEEYDNEPFLQGMYDVEAFRERVRSMADEDGLYDIYETPFPKADTTGVEIITDSQEMAIDNRIR